MRMPTGRPPHIPLLSTLFITYNGLLDPLGGSQILPYLISIASHPRELHVISFEKPERFANGADALSTELSRRGIDWHPLQFTSRAGKLGKAWDLLRMYTTALVLQMRHRFGIVHCRSYLAMQTGCFLRRITGVKTIFDMRGLWVDDRLEGDLWPQDKWIYRQIYRTYKRIERRLLECADSIVVLTHRVVPEIHRIAPEATASLTVIPCCADFDHFDGPDAASRSTVRRELGVPSDALMLSYLGSIGTVYLLEDMLRLFQLTAQSRREDDVHLLLITQDWGPKEEELLSNLGLGNLRSRIHVRPANRQEVPRFLGASDVTLSFRRSTYSQQACSPTKLAEAFAMGIPAISNAGIGDVEAITRNLDAGFIVDLTDPDALSKVAVEMETIAAKGGSGLRERARTTLGLEVAQERYRKLYGDLDETA